MAVSYEGNILSWDPVGGTLAYGVFGNYVGDPEYTSDWAYGNPFAGVTSPFDFDALDPLPAPARVYVVRFFIGGEAALASDPIYWTGTALSDEPAPPDPDPPPNPPPTPSNTYSKLSLGNSLGL